MDKTPSTLTDSMGKANDPVGSSISAIIGLTEELSKQLPPESATQNLAKAISADALAAFQAYINQMEMIDQIPDHYRSLDFGKLLFNAILTLQVEDPTSLPVDLDRSGVLYFVHDEALLQHLFNQVIGLCKEMGFPDAFAMVFKPFASGASGVTLQFDLKKTIGEFSLADLAIFEKLDSTLQTLDGRWSFTLTDVRSISLVIDLPYGKG